MTLLLVALAGCGVSMNAWDDTADEDTSDTGTDTDVVDTDTGADTGGADGVIGLVEFTRLQIACPACFDTTTDLIVDASAAFHAPADGSWIAWLPPQGTCSNAASAVPLATATQDMGAWTYLQSGSHSVGLSRTTGQIGTIYRAQGLDDADFLRNASWDVSVPDAPGGALLVEGGVHTTEGFSSITPYEMLYVEIGAAFAAAISRAGQRFTWAPSGSGDFFVVLVDAYDANTAAYLGSITCVGPDSGAINVPSSQLAAFPSGSLLGIGLYRYRHNFADAPGGGTLEAVSSSGVLGTGTLY